MKKLKVLGLVLSVFAVLLFAACGNGNDDNGDNGAENSVVQEWVDSYGAEMTADFEEPGISISVEVGREDELVLRFILEDEILDDMFAMGEDAALDLLSSMLDAAGPSFVMLANEARDDMGIDSLTITIVYEDSDGSELAAQSFDSE